jgi:hypothetical protein
MIPAICAWLLLSLTPSAHSKSFLGSDGTSDMAIPDMMALLLADSHPEAKLPLGGTHDGKHWAALNAMFKTLPKNLNGNLGLPAARYALHRLFEHHHRWFVHGLHPNSNISGKSQSVGQALQILSTFDTNGISLPALAAIANTLENLIQAEVAMHVSGAYEALGQPEESAIDGSRLKTISHDYMTIYISGANWANNTKEDIKEDDEFMKANTKDWPETLQWVEKTTQTIGKAQAQALDEKACQQHNIDDCKFDFNTSVRVLSKVVEGYGGFNDRECHKLKSVLLKMEEPRSGRVSLADFYKAGLSGAWAFNEKVEYLRALGALDESKPSQPRVIVTNYVSSWVNCLSSSKFYSVCCRNECEDYMRIMEKHINGPTADPDHIIRVIETAPTFIIEAPPALGSLKRRLSDIAHKHHGKVHIHGRLFAQWMHHAFPKTCPYPHESDKTVPMTPDQWMAETGHANIKASEAEMRQVMQSFAVGATGVEGPQPKEMASDIPWSDVEELLIVRPAPPAKSNGFLGDGAMVFELLAVVCLFCSVMWMASYWRQSRKAASTREVKLAI